jgi:hypothetical protein
MDAEQAYALMRDEDREMYLGRVGGWYLTYGGGPISDDEAARVIAMPNIVPRYWKDGRMHHDCYAYGKTIDLDRTSELRRQGKLRGRGECAFTDGTTGFPR